MTLLNAGYWPSTYWAEDYWNPRYWPAYTVAVAPTYAIGGLGRGVFPSEITPLPFDRETLRLLIRYLQLKLRM